ncbi:MAG: transcriptional repressor [Bacteroidales bacterium]|jgi:Fur family ferric uptake transcriptional regulator/Fur family peroxide stress response transcriptional regulator|nr:transcriptional repressor [Bacteroidales bacterium]
MNVQADIFGRLQAGGVKPSMQRIAVMEYLMTHCIHPTVDKIYSDLAPAMPTLSKTTVYNTLKLLSDRGIIRTISIDGKNLRYDADISRHAHFRCKRCGNVYDLQVEGLDKVKVNNAAHLLFTECQLYYNGFCEKCKNIRDSIN